MGQDSLDKRARKKHKLKVTEGGLSNAPDPEIPAESFNFRPFDNIPEGQSREVGRRGIETESMLGSDNASESDNNRSPHDLEEK